MKNSVEGRRRLIDSVKQSRSRGVCGSAPQHGEAHFVVARSHSPSVQLLLPRETLRSAHPRLARWLRPQIFTLSLFQVPPISRLRSRFQACRWPQNCSPEIRPVPLRRLNFVLPHHRTWVFHFSHSTPKCLWDLNLIYVTFLLMGLEEVSFFSLYMFKSFDFQFY